MNWIALLVLLCGFSYLLFLIHSKSTINVERVKSTFWDEALHMCLCQKNHGCMNIRRVGYLRKYFIIVFARVRHLVRCFYCMNFYVGYGLIERGMYKRGLYPDYYNIMCKYTLRRINLYISIFNILCAWCLI